MDLVSFFYTFYGLVQYKLKISSLISFKSNSSESCCPGATAPNESSNNKSSLALCCCYSNSFYFSNYWRSTRLVGYFVTFSTTFAFSCGFTGLLTPPIVFPPFNGRFSLLSRLQTKTLENWCFTGFLMAGTTTYDTLNPLWSPVVGFSFTTFLAAWLP